MTAEPVPDFEWYVAKNPQLGAPPRCRYASVNRCPRYFASLSLMGEAGATRIEKSEDERLLDRWKRSDIWPQTAEQDTTISHSTGADGTTVKTSMYVNFCPEVTFDFFGLFASFLGDYADEIDRDNAYRRLERTFARQNDWGWRWASIRAMHYSECPMYSLLNDRNYLDSSMDESKRLYLEKRLADMVQGVVDDCMRAVSMVMSEAARQNALGNSRVWLQYNDAIIDTIATAIPRLINFTFDVSGGHSPEATTILNAAIETLDENTRAALVKRTSLAAQAFGEKPMYESLGTRLKALREQAVEDFSHGIEGGRLMKKDQSSGISVRVTGSPGAQVAAGQHINQAMSQQSRFLVEAIDAALASDSFNKLDPDQAGLVRDYADLVRGEIGKPNADTGKVKAWTEKIQLYLNSADLLVEAGKIAAALLGYSG